MLLHINRILEHINVLVLINKSYLDDMFDKKKTNVQISIIFNQM